MNTTLKPTTPRMGDMIDASGMTEEQCRILTESFSIHMADKACWTLLFPSCLHGTWYCWTEDNSIELGTHAEHIECLMDADCDMRVLEFDFDSGKFYTPSEQTTTHTNQATQTAYADNINYYKRIIQARSFDINKITRQEAYRKLGYWEGRYDELTTGGR